MLRYSITALGLLLTFVTSACGYQVGTNVNPVVDGGSTPPVSKTFAGTGDSEISNPATTSVTVAAPVGVTWNEAIINLGADFLNSNICTGKTIFGRAGSATCNAVAGVFGDFTAATPHRDVGAVQQTLSEQHDDGLAAGYRAIPEVTKDDDGYHQATTGGSAAIGSACANTAESSTQTCSTAQWLAARPSVNCGTSGTIGDRIDDCATSNPTAHSWSGEDHGLAGEGTWSLVTRLADTAGRNYEVWRDDRTKLIWSDRLGTLNSVVNQGNFNWCLASGNTQGLPSIECRLATPTSYNNVGISLCHDDGAGVTTTPDGVHDDSSLNDLEYWGDQTPPDGRSETQQFSVIRAKGNLTNVTWRLPTRNDYMQAMVNGIQYVVPNVAIAGGVTAVHWGATTISNNRNNAWTINLSNGRITDAVSSKTSTYAVRCVGSGE